MWTIARESLAAVVGASPPVNFQGLARADLAAYLLAHQRVVEAVMRASTALPVKFGTTLPDPSAIVSLLVHGAPILAPPLAELSQYIQVELVVSWKIDDVLHEIAAEDAILLLKAQISAQSQGATTDQRVAVGKLVKESIDRRRAFCRNGIVAKMRSLTTDLIENSVMDDRMVANLALLLPKDASDMLDHELAELDSAFDGRLDFRCVGPLPPYSFATVEVSLPSFEAVDRARRVLSLGTHARLTEIKSAYHRRIREAHPDLASNVAVDSDCAAKLTDAYKTLINYAAALPGACGVDVAGARGFRFDRGAVENSIFVAVRRQTPAAAHAEIAS